MNVIKKFESLQDGLDFLGLERKSVIGGIGVELRVVDTSLTD